MLERNNQYTDLEHLELVASRIAESGVDITSRYQDWMSVTFACASLGEAARECYHTVCRQYPAYSREECDKKFDNCLRTGRGDITLATLIKMAADHGIDTTLPRGRRPKAQQQRREEKESTFKAAADYLKECALWWYNTWTIRVEIKEPGKERRPVTERDFSTYYCQLKGAGIRISARDVEHLIKSRDFTVDDDPFRNWFEGLPKWQEGDPDYINEFFVGHMEFGDPENKDFYRLLFQKWFVAMVGLWFGYVDENPIVPVLWGSQHIGKTYFVRHILPPELRSYLFPVNPAARVDKDFEISVSETPLMFLDEFNITSLQKSEAYKYIVTSSKSYLRDSYGHFREMRERKASFIAATNHENFIRESEGMRRYLAVCLKGTVNLHDHPLPYEGAYAQALYLLNSGFNPKPTQEESQLITEHNQPYVMTDDVTEALRTFVRQPEGDEMAQAYSAGDLLKELRANGFANSAFNTVSIGKAMKTLGFTPHKVRGANKYLIVIANMDRQERERKQDALLKAPNP